MNLTDEQACREWFEAIHALIWERLARVERGDDDGLGAGPVRRLIQESPIVQTDVARRFIARTQRVLLFSSTQLLDPKLATIR